MLNTLRGFWWLDHCKINKLHKRYGKGAGKNILVIDSGVNLVPGLEGVIALPKLSVGDAPGDASQVGHGTAVTSVLKKIAPESLISVLDVEVNNLSYDLQGLEWTAVNYDNYKWDIINISRYSGNTQEYKDPLIYLRKKGVIVVACAGNNSLPQPEYPAYWTKEDLCLAIGACNKKGKKAPFSNEGYDILLPGVDIKYLWKNPPPKWSWGQGTSFAAPIASGILTCGYDGETIEGARMFLKEWMR